MNRKLNETGRLPPYVDSDIQDIGEDDWDAAMRADYSVPRVRDEGRATWVLVMVLFGASMLCLGALLCRWFA